MKNIFLAATLMVISILPAKSQDSTNNNPITKKLGLAFFPLENKAGVAYCFGKKGRMKIEYDFKLPFSETYLNIPLGQYTEIDELKFTYSWKSTGVKKIYSGVVVEHQVIYYDPEQKSYAFGPKIIPLGFELFPTGRLPGLSIILESNYTYTSGLGGRVGLCYYL